MCRAGIKNADEAELRQLASEPVDLNVYNVSDFPLLNKVVSRLVHILCGRIEERGASRRKLPLSKTNASGLRPAPRFLTLSVPSSPEAVPRTDTALLYPSPTDLRFSDLGSREVRLKWANPAQPVQQYRVVYHSSDSQTPQEVSGASYSCWRVQIEIQAQETQPSTKLVFYGGSVFDSFSYALCIFSLMSQFNKR